MSLVSQDHKQQQQSKIYNNNHIMNSSMETNNNKGIVLNKENYDPNRLTTRMVQPQVRRKKRKWKQPRQVFKPKKTKSNNDEQDEENKKANKNKHNNNNKQEENNLLRQMNPLFLNFNDQNFDLPIYETQNNFLTKIEKLLQKTKNKVYSKTELLQFGLPSKIIGLKRNNCLNFKFSFQELDLINLLELLKSTKNCVTNFTKQGIGFEEIRSRLILYLLIVRTKEHPSNEWITNHYQRVVYDLGSKLRLYPKQLSQLYQKKLYFTPLHILNKLKERYRIEFTEKKQSPLSQIVDSPSLLTKGIILEISSIQIQKQQSNIQKQKQQSNIQTMTETEMEDFFSIFDQFEQEEQNGLKKKDYSTTTTKITPTHTPTKTTTPSSSTSSRISSTSSSNAITTCFSNSTEKTTNSQKYRIELTDGWYSIKALFDNHLLTLIDEGKLIEGSRLQILNSQISGFGKVTSALGYLSSDIRLSLSFNSTRIVSYNTKLGFPKPNQQLTPISLSLLKPNGGKISCIDIIIQRKSPLWLTQKKYNCNLRFRDPLQRNNEFEKIFPTNSNQDKHDENGGSILNNKNTSKHKKESIVYNSVNKTDNNKNKINNNKQINNNPQNTKNCSNGNNGINNDNIGSNRHTNMDQVCNNSNVVISNSNIKMSIIQNDNLVQNKNSEQNVNNHNNNINNSSNTNNNNTDMDMNIEINSDFVNNIDTNEPNENKIANNNNQKEWWGIHNNAQYNNKDNINNKKKNHNSSSFFELKIIDYNANSTTHQNDKIIQIWDDSIPLWRKLKEGSRVKIYNLDFRRYSGFNENSETSFLTNIKTKFEILQENVNKNLFIPRVLTNLPSLIPLTNQTRGLNFIGILIYYSTENSIYYLADENLILAKIHLSQNSDYFFMKNSIVGSSIITAHDIYPKKYDVSTKVLTFDTNKYSFLANNNPIEKSFNQRYNNLSTYFNSDLGKKHKLHLMGHVDCIETDFEDLFL
ncbi:breast cancer type 2 susceptibility protein [Anaeramoeba flamelloides]|uniref:Breast cancer type 2 susceptibility protein n=1 Tax=Anaeramoeba flamelloides TaxID=1746091 RepID=A0AAV7ZVC0_9EUKA|nr:breast cancer type 2 susceptibility protein [Anaeramoeba flamelloides]